VSRAPRWGSSLPAYRITAGAGEAQTTTPDPRWVRPGRGSSVQMLSGSILSAQSQAYAGSATLSIVNLAPETPRVQPRPSVVMARETSPLVMAWALTDSTAPADASAWA